MSRRVASLPMYDADPDAVDAWWRALAPALRAEGLADVPDGLAWPDDLDRHWRDPTLLLSQTCGYPLVTRLRGAVQVVGAFRYTAPGCSGIDYRSAVVVRIDEAERSPEGFRGRVAAINAPDSQSGCHALHAWAAPLARDGRFFGDELVSGSHRRSLDLVREGRADLAAIDCVTLAGLVRRRPDVLDGLRVVDTTPPSPGLPLVTSPATPPDDLRRLRRAIETACADPASASCRDALFIGDFVAVDASAWSSIDPGRRGTTASPSFDGTG